MKSTNIGRNLSRQESETDTLTTLPSGPIYAPSHVTNIREWLISLQHRRPASHTPLLDEDEEPVTKETSGPTRRESFARYDPNTSSWKTCLVLLNLAMVDHPTFSPYSETLPRWVMWDAQALYRLETPVPVTGGRDGGAWQSNVATMDWPTPTVNMAPQKRANIKKWGGNNTTELMAEAWATPKDSDANGPGTHGDGGPDLRTQTQMWATPTARDYRTGEQNQPVNFLLGRQVLRMPLGGHESSRTDPGLPQRCAKRLNVLFVEALQGLPLGWTSHSRIDDSEYRRWATGWSRFKLP